MKHLRFIIMAVIIVSFSLQQLYSQVTFSNLKKAVSINSSSIPTLFKGYKKEHIDKSNRIYFGNIQNTNTITIEQKQGSNIVHYGFDDKTTFQQFYSEIDKISSDNGCNMIEDIENRTILGASCECKGYFYFLNTLRYGNIVAGYQLKIAKVENKKFIVKESKIVDNKKAKKPIVAYYHADTPILRTFILGGYKELKSDSLPLTQYISKHLNETALGDYIGQFHFKLKWSFGKLEDVEIKSEFVPQEVKDELLRVIKNIKTFSLKGDGFDLHKKEDYSLSLNFVRKPVRKWSK